MHKPPLPSRSLEAARRLRSDQTDAERALWRLLRAGQLSGSKFRRQHAVPPYVVDFYCHAAALVIELDGSQHSAAVDEKRTQFLQARGLKLLRFWDNAVLQQPHAVAEAIFNAIGNRTLTPTPLPAGEGL